jgi:hypothetical protein
MIFLISKMEVLTLPEISEERRLFDHRLGVREEFPLRGQETTIYTTYGNIYILPRRTPHKPARPAEGLGQLDRPTGQAFRRPVGSAVRLCAPRYIPSFED